MDSIFPVWDDNTQYDFLQHGPPYLPRSLVKSSNRKVASGGSLEDLLPLLRLEAMVHQTNHWTARGPEFFGDHQLYAQLYEDVTGMIDGLAERLIGLFEDCSHLQELRQLEVMARLLTILGSDYDELGRSLAVVDLFLDSCGAIYSALSESQSLTPGLDNLLQGFMDTHERHKYLLGQRGRSYRV